jgi:hypothetical protein
MRLSSSTERIATAVASFSPVFFLANGNASNLFHAWFNILRPILYRTLNYRFCERRWGCPYLELRRRVKSPL